jgi:dienelactone hydrolase
MNKYYNYPSKAVWDTETSEKNDFASGVIDLAKESKWVGPNYVFEKTVNSRMGRDMADAAELELKYSDVNDPGLKAHWDNMGLDYTVHEKNGESWISFVPKSAYEQEKQYPVIMCFRPASGRWGVFAQCFYYNLIELAAQDEMIILMFSTEDPDANELYYDILKEAETLYPIDATRVYLTGHSHYGEFALQFMCNHHEIIAGVAQQGDRPGLPLHSGFMPYGINSQEKLDLMHSIDMPLIDVAGWAEMNQLFPVNTDAPNRDEISEMAKRSNSIIKADRIEAWQNRLYASRCKVNTVEEIENAANGTRAEKMLGFPTAHSETMFVDGVEVYIGDIMNEDGNILLRVASVENLTHTTCRYMQTLTWSFLRRFARDLTTGKVIELYK